MNLYVATTNNINLTRQSLADSTVFDYVLLRDLKYPSLSNDHSL